MIRTHHWKIEKIIETDKDKIESYYENVKISLVCSGTASLEIAKRGIPQLIIYKLNYFTELIGSFFVKVRYANIINILENKMLIPELTNSSLNKKIFVKKFKDLLENNKCNDDQIRTVRKVIRKIEMPISPCKIAAKEILKYIQ